MAERRPRLSLKDRVEISIAEDERRAQASKTIGELLDDMAHGMTIEESKKGEVYVNLSFGFKYQFQVLSGNGPNR